MLTLPRRAAAVVVTGAAVTALALPSASADQLIGRHMVMGQIETTYFSLSGAAGLGVPVSDELPDRRGGRFQRFADQASIYWHPLVAGGNAHQVGGAIRDRWGTLNWETGPLGYPINDEMRQIAAGIPTFGNLTKIPMSLGKRVFGAYSDFQGGSIYWSPQTGAHPVWGAVKQVFDQAGGLARYGWPITDEINTGGRFVQRFQNGEISWP